LSCATATARGRLRDENASLGPCGIHLRGVGRVVGDGTLRKFGLPVMYVPPTWEEFRALVEVRLRDEPDHGVFLVLRAAALLHLRRAGEAAETLRHLDRLGTGGVRRSRSLVLHADRDGRPIQHSAVFQGRIRGSTHYAWCDAIREEVQFIPFEFKMETVRRGEVVSPFHLVVRYRGLFAEPVSRLGWR
jgi:hypothetical protein